MSAAHRHYVDEAGGYAFRVKDIASGTLVWYQPRKVAGNIQAAHPSKSWLLLSPAPAVVNRMAARGEAPPGNLYVKVDVYGYVGPLQKHGTMTVRGLAAQRDEVERVMAVVK